MSLIFKLLTIFKSIKDIYPLAAHALLAAHPGLHFLIRQTFPALAHHFLIRRWWVFLCLLIRWLFLVHACCLSYMSIMGVSPLPYKASVSGQLSPWFLEPSAFRSARPWARLEYTHLSPRHANCLLDVAAIFRALLLLLMVPRIQIQKLLLHY